MLELRLLVHARRKLFGPVNLLTLCNYIFTIYPDCSAQLFLSFTPYLTFVYCSHHIEMGLDGVEIFANGSGSHHELRKGYIRRDLISSATMKVNGMITKDMTMTKQILIQLARIWSCPPSTDNHLVTP